MKSGMFKVICFVVAVVMIAGLMILPSAAKVDLSRKYPLDATSPLADLYIGFFGDSICEGMVEMNTDYASVRAWAGRIAAVNGCKFDNHGRSGASISNCRGANTVMTQLQNAKRAGKDYDMIVLHGGVNDAWDDVAVGEISVGYPPTESYDSSTFAPGLEQVISYVEENFPDATMCYIINFKFLNASMGISLMDMDRYVDATIEICDKWGVPYLDLYHNEELVDALHPYTGSGSSKRYQNTYLYDFVHPSTLGFDLIYPYVNEFLINLIDPDYLEDKKDELPEEPPVDDPTDDPTDEPTDDPVDDPVDDPTDDPTDDPKEEPEEQPQPEPETPTEDKKGGCGASISLSAAGVGLMTVCAAAWVWRKKTER